MVSRKQLIHKTQLSKTKKTNSKSNHRSPYRLCRQIRQCLSAELWVCGRCRWW